MWAVSGFSQYMYFTIRKILTILLIYNYLKKSYIRHRQKLNVLCTMISFFPQIKKKTVTEMTHYNYISVDMTYRKLMLLKHTF